jgi:hypothetical protein
MIRNKTGPCAITWLFTSLLSAALTLPIAVSAQTNPVEDTAKESDNNAQPAQIDEPKPAPQRTEEEGSPFDYKSSEKISEDLSVSFPVDI